MNTDHHGGHTWSNSQGSSGPLPSKHRALMGVGRPLPSASGVVLGHDHRSMGLCLEPGRFPLGPLSALVNMRLILLLHESPSDICCITMPPSLLSQRLNTAVPQNINPAIRFTNTALAWMCFLASVPIKRHIFRIKSTHYSCFAIPLLQLMPAASIINTLDVVYFCKPQLIL